MVQSLCLTPGRPHMESFLISGSGGPMNQARTLGRMLKDIAQGFCVLTGNYPAREATGILNIQEGHTLHAIERQSCKPSRATVGELTGLIPRLGFGAGDC